ncbi:hypothetical protein [Caballeronia sp. Lep1P3]|uniref:hypothetical protein n=1 Tax=Caballeronia sp. Lep1P3 TaxID=2878150 RepID=UPI001FD1D729|nr:hypothetical protein [Caballeronia sp. Lep1P3]
MMRFNERAALEQGLPASLSTVLSEGDDRLNRATMQRPARAFGDLRADAARLRRALAASTCVMVAWSLFEVPWELDTSSTREEVAAVVTAKAMLTLIAALSLRGRRTARYLLLFVCLTSMLAVAPELPGEFAHAWWLAVLSSVECLTKLVTLVLIALQLKPRSN